MPFTEESDRKKMLRFLQTGELPEVINPGDWCFLAYRDMRLEWLNSRRWTTAHNIYKRVRKELPLIEDEDKAVALDLAWQMFFAFHVLEYEREKRELNGEVND